MGRNTKSSEHQSEKSSRSSHHSHHSHHHHKDEKHARSRGAESLKSSTSSNESKASSSAGRSEPSDKGAIYFDGPSPPARSPPKSGSPKEKSPKATSPKTEGGVSIKPAPIVPSKNVDFGMSQWTSTKTSTARDTPARPTALSKLGQEARVGLNTFAVTKYPTKRVYQYDVMIGNGLEKRAVIEKVWKSRAVREQFKGMVIFDGNALAWGQQDLGSRDIRLVVDLDKEEGRKPRAGKEGSNTWRIVIRQAKVLRFEVLDHYLQGKAAPDTSIIEAINFLDHLLRENPSRTLIPLKRSYYPKTGDRFDLGTGLDAVKGVYQSLRMATGPPRGLTINVDVANGTFFKELMLVQMAYAISGRRDINDLCQAAKQGEKSRLAQDLKRLKRVHVIATHRKTAVPDAYCIDTFLWGGAKGIKFEYADPNTGSKAMISVYDYFQRVYNIRIQHPELPVVRTTKGAFLPMEILRIKPNQSCRYKLDERQTSNMIKFAVTPPPERWNAVQQGLRTLNWQNDPVLKEYGLEISTQRTTVAARVLQAPKVQFGAGGTAQPGTSGRWDLKGKKFLNANPQPLKSWGVCAVPSSRGGKPDKTIIENFLRQFVNIYASHGGRVESKQPCMSLAETRDPAEWVTTLWNKTGNQFSQRPQILLFILPDKDALTYNKIKRSTDCRYGVVSQCMQYSHVQKAQAQYISNVCMKFNAKLGGATARAIGPRSGGENGLFTVPTVVVGADVSHAAPGSQASSSAAMTVSMDKLGLRYAAACDTNGHRIEMIEEANMEKHMKPMLQHWCSTVNGGKIPARVIYIRDGVAENQFVDVLNQEVAAMKKILNEVASNQKVDFVVVIAQKRHHIRFFPDKGDRNGNAFPGTLVEGGATHPFENDFFLCSHAAIKGTARPTHYQVILNEAKMSNDELYTILYEQVYQYMRATTPVSMHPAVYYAHIAALRAISHEKHYGTDKSTTETSHSGDPVIEPMLEMPNQNGIQTSMWYI